MQSYAELMNEINECLRGLVVQTEIPKTNEMPDMTQESQSQISESETQKVTWIPVKVHGVPGSLVRRVRKN